MHSTLQKYKDSLGVFAEGWVGMSAVRRPAVLPCKPRGPASTAAPAARRARRLMPRLRSGAGGAGFSSHKMRHTGTLTDRRQFDPLDV